MHGGLRRADAEEMFNRSYFQILRNLKAGVYQNNTAFPRQHLIKVICGYGHHSLSAYKGALKQHFLDFFIENLFDFAYSEQHGTFLLRVKY